MYRNLDSDSQSLRPGASHFLHLKSSIKVLGSYKSRSVRKWEGALVPPGYADTSPWLLHRAFQAALTLRTQGSLKSTFIYAPLDTPGTHLSQVFWDSPSPLLQDPRMLPLTWEGRAGELEGAGALCRLGESSSPEPSSLFYSLSLNSVRFVENKKQVCLQPISASCPDM